METIALRPPAEVKPVDPLSINPDPGLMGQMYINARGEAYPDGMTLARAETVLTYEKTIERYEIECKEPGFSDVAFFEKYFVVAPSEDVDLRAEPGQTLDAYTLAIRPNFIRSSKDNESKVDAHTRQPYDSPVAGVGRFGGHSYLWDGYHIAHGYKADEQWKIPLNTAYNAEHQIFKFGHLLNGTADFYVTRAQPPYFPREVQMLAGRFGKEALVRFLPAMEKDYTGYWMDGMDELAALPDDGEAHAHRTLVRMPDGSLLNRYWDDAEGPRLESYKEDVDVAELATKGLMEAVRAKMAEAKAREQQGTIDERLEEAGKAYLEQQKERVRQRKQEIYKHLRAGAASGWDYSSRWFKDGSTLKTINTADIAPVDLNSLMAYNEETLAMAYEAAVELKSEGYDPADCIDKAAKYRKMAANRIAAINKYLWDPKDKIYRDYNFVDKHQTAIVSAAMVYPLYVGIANAEQTFGVADAVERDLLYPGGIIATTTENSSEQWDGGTKDGTRSKNVWAPPNWAAVRGLARMAHILVKQGVEIDSERLLVLAEKARTCYMRGVEMVFDEHRVVPEKHRGNDPAKLADGGEYKLVEVLAMSAETYRAFKKLDVRDAADHMPLGRLALVES